MPIKPENRAKYPANWKTEIRPAILERANNCCETCGVENYAVGFREECGKFSQVESCSSHEMAQAMKIASEQIYIHCDLLVIVLTIAHLDHNQPGNLRALCRRCHNRLKKASKHNG